VIAAFTNAATEQGFARKTNSNELIFYKAVENGSLRTALEVDDRKGEHRIVLVDWPRVSRSAESVAFEKAVRTKLENP
jgi:hypothetical protein